MSEPVWKLANADELIGEIHITDGDFPWLSGTFIPHPGFAQFKPLFDRELQLIDGPGNPDTGDAMEAWEETYEAISSALTLINDRGTPVADFLLHIHEGDAWFRWSDEGRDEP
ncbi:hypothetical protein [Nocardia sp. NBC_01329]|uniref:hypothetical protein n=1 Tax=Nocardia sp. NBC_01329 TaxID=2903594 RepID=UPI002E1522F3|nr:hypothetical protein OG405_26205 [Nocardia sp. NBC_01329]